MADLETVEDPEEINDLRQMIQRHADLTQSQKAQRVLAQWEALLPKFVKVMPRDYKRVLQALAQAMADGLSGDEALTAAFEANAKDVARIGGS
jgi:glutamate synthase (ferredoxin)